MNRPIEHPSPTSTLHRPRGGADMLAMTYATTAAMWTLGYIGRLPFVDAAPAILGVGMMLVLLIGGYLTGRLTARGTPGGFVVGLLVGMLNLLILGSIFGSEKGAEFNRWALAWIPGTMAFHGLLCALGAAVGRRGHRPDSPEWNFNELLTLSLVVMTGLLLIAGGLVTSREAGLAVPDWPASYGYNMFLYPLARMTGNIYLEHAHRLYGALVGFTTIILAIHLWRNDPRRWLRVVMALAVIAVCLQGVMGGVRVTAPELADGVEMALETRETPLSAALRVTHGVFGQVFFGLIVAVAVFCSRAWTSPRPPQINELAPTDRAVGVMLVLALLLQLLLGALVRHLRHEAMLHMSFAAIVFVLALAAALRAWGIHGIAHPALRRAGIALLTLVSLQLLLGIAALVAIGFTHRAGAPTASDVFFSTAHQANGAALLAVAVALMLFNYRLLAPPPVAAASSTGPPAAARTP